MWTSTCEQRASASLTVGLFGGTFCLRGRIGERKHDRLLVHLRHRPQHLGRECTANRGNTNDRGWLERADCRQEVTDRSMLMCVWKFFLREAHAILHDQAA